MEIWLRHESHGVKCAYLPTEAEIDEKNGWIRFDPFARDEKSADLESVDGDESPKKRGRPAKQG